MGVGGECVGGKTPRAEPVCPLLRLCADENKQWPEITRVGCSESRNVSAAAFAGVLKIVSGGPVDRCMAETHCDVGVGGDAAMPAIAVRERVNLDQPVMKARGGFQRRECAVPGPMASVVEQMSELDRDLEWIDADILFGPAKLPRPLPDFAEQAAMEIPHELLCQNIRLAAPAEPEKAAFDIDLLQLVELAARRDVPESQARHFIGIERCRPL